MKKVVIIILSLFLINNVNAKEKVTTAYETIKNALLKNITYVEVEL